jgi:T5orf172 domain-containing protein
MVRYIGAMSAYQYSGVPLTPTVFASLARELVQPGEAISRTDLVRLVGEEHERRGGLPARGVAMHAAKKALSQMVEDGEAVSVAYGYWRIVAPTDPASISEPIVLGAGPESVYVYYFPAYRDQAAYLGRHEWPMKIGMTKGEVNPRIKDQSGTAMPEQPIVGMIYRTISATNAERMLHATLQERGRRIVDSPGKEWFVTSIDEVRSILDFATAR